MVCRTLLTFLSILQLTGHVPPASADVGWPVPALAMLCTAWLWSMHLSVSAQGTLLAAFLTLHIKSCLPIIHKAILLSPQITVLWKYFPVCFRINHFHSHYAIRMHASFYLSFTPQYLYAAWNVDSIDSCRKSNKFTNKLKKGRRKARLKFKFEWVRHPFLRFFFFFKILSWLTNQFKEVTHLLEAVSHGGHVEINLNWSFGRDLKYFLLRLITTAVESVLLVLTSTFLAEIK